MPCRDPGGQQQPRAEALWGICGLWLWVLGGGKCFSSCDYAFYVCLIAFLSPSGNGQEGLCIGVCSDLVLICLGSLQPWPHLHIRGSQCEDFPHEMLVCAWEAEPGSQDLLSQRLQKVLFSMSESLLERK